jgi:hypothetical protein
VILFGEKMKEYELNFKFHEEDIYDLNKVDAKLLKMIYKSVFIFKEAIENNTVDMDNLSKPNVKVYYPVKVMWNNLDFENLDLKYNTERQDIYIYSPIDGELIDNVVLPNDNVTLFKEVTNYSLYINNNGKQKYIFNELHETMIKRILELEKYSDRNFYKIGSREYRFSVEFDDNGEGILGSTYYFRITGLFIDINKKSAEYLVEFGLDLHIFEYNEIIDKDTVYDKIFAAIDEYVDRKNKSMAGKFPSKDLLSAEEKTFAVPSHPIMFTLLAMFAGRPERIPRKLLQKPYNEMTDKERKEADIFLNSIIEKEKEYNVNKDAYDEKRIAVVSDNPRVEAKAEIGAALFADDLIFREGALALYIKRAFGAEGLRHLLGLLIGLEESGRKGTFEWSINEHLKRLGYRKHRGTYKYDLKITATEIVKIFTSLFITARSKNKKGVEIIEGQKLFSIDGFKQETFNKVVIDETITLRATDFWYRNAFEPKDGTSPKFTKLLYKIAQENHREHPLTIYLAPLFAVFWRINHEGRKLRLDNLIDWCDIKRDRRLRQRIRELESELDYMKDQGYLGEWQFSGDSKVLSECKDPLNAVLSFFPPNWLSGELQLIATKKEQILAEYQLKEKQQEKSLVTKEQLEVLIKNSGLSNRAFAQKVGISPSLITRMLKGERSITEKMSERIRSRYDSIPE